MKRIAPFVLIAFAAFGLLGTPSTAQALPPCPEDQNYRNCDNCFGTYTWPWGAKYVGEWQDGKRNGQGTETFADGDKYVGGWLDDNKHGQGTYTFADGDEYVGEFKDGLPNGQGTITDADG